jgi:hypothetical protein
MEDLISTMKQTAHVGQGSDLRELQVCLLSLLQAMEYTDIQAQLNETLPNVPINRSSQNAGSLFDCPPPPASSWNDQPAQNAFLSSSPFTARLMAHAAAQANPNQNQNQNRGSIPAPNAGSGSQQQQQNQNQSKQNGGQGQGQAMENRRETRSSHKAMSPETDHFANDAFRPLYEKSEGKSKGFGKGK